MKIRRILQVWAIVGFGLFLSGDVLAQAKSFSDFRLGVMGIKPSASGSDPFSVDLHWTPSLSHQDLTIRADIGLNLVDPSGADQFAIFGYEIYFEQVIEGNVSCDAGGGFQNWLEHGGITPVASTHLLWSLGKESKFIKNAYAGLSKSFGEQASWQWRVGLGLRIY